VRLCAYLHVSRRRRALRTFAWLNVWLLQNPDLLLLDEPTNHLDLETVEWLENYLKEQTVPMVIVSHDRAFLDQLCTKIVETERGVSKTWRGNYSEYLAQKQTWITAQVRPTRVRQAS
jgi:ATP-binding cassette subfamily F protein 3